MFFSGSISSQALGGFTPVRRRSATTGSSLVVEPEHDGHQGQRRRPDFRDALPAQGDHHERRAEFGDRRADIAGAENPERRALLAGLVPARDIGDADREGAAGDADAERREQELRIGLRVSQQVGRERRREHDDAEDAASAILVGPDAERETDQRPGQDRRADQQAELRLAEAEVLFDLDADDGENRPHRKAQREGDSRNPEGARGRASVMHYVGHCPIRQAARKGASCCGQIGDGNVIGSLISIKKQSYCY